MNSPNVDHNMAAKATKGICDDHQHPAVADFDFDTLNCCPLKVGSIQAIDKESVHRICSGQVVLTLATAVKELVENSIDAGATTVGRNPAILDIKLREYGSESIEVTDNGSGVEEKNFLGLTKKHYTSKLSDFSDLVSVETFGFRGEALSSLCALSRMAISTCHKSAAIGTRLEYDGNGQIVSKTPVPRQQGTTVTLQNIFYSLPVRHKEFQRNLKKEFSKMVQVLNAYCIISTGVRITGSNQANKGNRSVVLSTNGNSSVKENIANIFGSKQLQGLVPFEQSLPSENDCSDFGIQYNVGHADLFSIEGFVSKCDHGQGRSSTDRQFLFINKRPCDASKILKVINEVYHSYNRHQYPFVVLLISLAKDSVDVNVTPDKRQIFLEGEKFLLATIKTSLVKMFEPTTSVLRLNLIPHESGFPKLNTVTVSSPAAVDLQSSSSAHRLSPDSLKGQSQNNIKDGAMSSLARLKRSFSSAFDRTDTTDSLSPSKMQTDKQKKRNYSTPARFSPDKGSITRFLTSYSASPGKRENKDGSLPVSSKPLVCDLEPSEPAIKETVYALFAETVSGIDSNPKKLDSCSAENTCMHKACAETEFGEVTVDVESQRNLVTLSPSASLPQERDLDLADAQEGNFPGNHHEHFQSVHRAVGAGFIDLTVDEEDSRQEPLKVVNCLSEKNSSKTEVLESDHFISNAYFRDKMKENCTLHRKMTSGEIKDKGSSSGTLSVTITQLDMEEQHQRPKLELNFSLQLLQKCVTSAKNLRENNFARSFRAKICPTDNSSAEEELKREISKDMFAKMDVLGQFNLGFIIVRSGDDLFIVDQHATDEKYNFEMLQQHTVLQTQQLIHPQGLELTASNEVTLLDNLHIFRKNGFDFIIDETALPTQRVKLKSAPVSKNWSFGKDDIEELVFMLTDSPGVMCRPSRVRMMFASRACRKSVMIGTHLNKNEMKRLLCHMGEIEQPWNCPHGRPTIRHLINLNMLPQ